MQLSNLILNENRYIIPEQNQNLWDEVNSEEEFLRHGLDGEKGEIVPFILNARTNYVGKESSILDSERKSEDANLGAPNYWTFKNLMKSLHP